MQRKSKFSEQSCENGYIKDGECIPCGEDEQPNADKTGCDCKNEEYEKINGKCTLKGEDYGDVDVYGKRIQKKNEGCSEGQREVNGECVPDESDPTQTPG